jgi:uncharacterized protein YkwD
MNTSAPKRIFRVLLSAACALALCLALAPAASAAKPCKNANALPGEVTNKALVKSTLCLLNKQRTRRGMRKLRLNRRLSRAAAAHAKDMVTRRYFSHDSPSGHSVVDRIKKVGYLSSVRAWSVGENIAWGAGEQSTPKQIMQAWMNSAGHRANILTRQFREIGIGVALGAPTGGGSRAATYVNDFGMRR